MNPIHCFRIRKHFAFAALVVLAAFVFSVYQSPEEMLASQNQEMDSGEAPKPDHPGEAYEFRKMQWQDENGFIPRDGLVKAAQHIRKMQLSRLDALDTAGITRNSWEWLGPGNIGDVCAPS